MCVYIYIYIPPCEGLSRGGKDDCADGLMEIIAAGRSVWAAIHTGGVHYTQQQDGVSEQLIGTGRRRRDAAGTGMTGADWWWGSSCWGDTEVTRENDWWDPVRRRQSFSPVCCRLINWVIHLFVLDHECTRASCFYLTVVPFFSH